MADDNHNDDANDDANGNIRRDDNNVAPPPGDIGSPLRLLEVPFFAPEEYQNFIFATMAQEGYDPVALDLNASLAENAADVMGAVEPSGLTLASLPPQIVFFSRQDGLVVHALSFLDTYTLVQNKLVSKKWKGLCAMAIDNKCPDPKPFEANLELRTVVAKYCGKKPEDIEEIPCTYGVPINKWPVHKLKNFSGVFKEMDTFNEYIGGWDMSNAENLDCMFCYASSFNHPLPWDTSKVTNMRRVFSKATSFNQPLPWNTSSATTIEAMFYYAPSFNQPLLWDTSNVNNMYAVFACASSFNQLLQWITSSATTMEAMFNQACSFNQPLPWDTSNVNNMRGLFCGAFAFNQPLPWNTSSVTTMEYLFAGATSFNKLLPWDTSRVTNMSCLFGGAESFNQPLPWNTSSVTEMELLFCGASSFNQPLQWDTALVTHMAGMLMGATSFNYSLAALVISRVENMDGMLYKTPALHFQNMHAEMDPAIVVAEIELSLE